MQHSELSPVPLSSLSHYSPKMNCYYLLSLFFLINAVSSLSQQNSSDEPSVLNIKQQTDKVSSLLVDTMEHLAAEDEC